MTIEKQQALLIRVMDLFAERFNKRAVLRGGMVLRVLGCQRLTNDVDYLFMPYKSKKDIVDEVVNALREIPGAEVKHTLNSKCLRAILTVDKVSIQVEVKAAMAAPVQVVSTKELAAEVDLPPRLIQVLDYSVAMAHKMAAWNERRLVRDLYDIWFYLRMGIRPDAETLSSRLRKPSYSKLIKKKDHFCGNGIEEFYDFLLLSVNQLSDKEIGDALSDYLSKEEIQGLAMKFRAELVKLKG